MTILKVAHYLEFGMTPEEYERILQRPAIKRRNSDCGQLQAPIVEQTAGYAPHAEVPREKDSKMRLLVEFVSYRKRLIDPDNISVKSLLDCLRRERFIPDDSAKYIELRVRQVKSDNERTEIRIKPETKAIQE